MTKIEQWVSEDLTRVRTKPQEAAPEHLTVAADQEKFTFFNQVGKLNFY